MKDVTQAVIRKPKILRWGVAVIHFLRHCFYFAWIDALSAAFGWATVINAAALVYLAGRLGIAINSGQNWPSILLYASACFVVGLVIAFAINFLFVAPVKAYRLMRPLVVHISGEARSPDFVFHESARGYNSTVVVRNRSHVHLLDCTAHIIGVIWHDGKKYDRFVEKFDLPPTSTKNIYVAYWFARDGEWSDDKEINLSGPVGAGFGGNRLTVPSEGTELTVKIEARGVETKFVRCRVWVDKNRRTLVTAHLGR